MLAPSKLLEVSLKQDGYLDIYSAASHCGEERHGNSHCGEQNIMAWQVIAMLLVGGRLRNTLSTDKYLLDCGVSSLTGQIMNTLSSLLTKPSS